MLGLTVSLLGCVCVLFGVALVFLAKVGGKDVLAMNILGCFIVEYY